MSIISWYFQDNILEVHYICEIRQFGSAVVVLSVGITWRICPMLPTKFVNFFPSWSNLSTECIFSSSIITYETSLTPLPCSSLLSLSVTSKSYKEIKSAKYISKSPKCRRKPLAVALILLSNDCVSIIDKDSIIMSK